MTPKYGGRRTSCLLPLSFTRSRRVIEGGETNVALGVGLPTCRYFSQELGGVVAVPHGLFPLGPTFVIVSRDACLRVKLQAEG